MLTEERILQNKNFFLEKNKEYNILPVELINFLGDDLFIAPATTSKDMYYAYPGGLISFIINVTLIAIIFLVIIGDMHVI